MLPKVTLKGEYSLEAWKNGTPVRSTGFFPNLITNAGMDMLGGIGSSSWHYYLQVGVSGAVPNYTDTALTSWIASKLNSAPFSNAIDTTNKKLIGFKTWVFNPGNVVGVIKEVGVGAVSNGQLFSKASLLDFKGDPSTFEVFADETLVVTYRLNMQQPDDYIGEVSGQSYIIRPRLASTIGGNGWGWEGSPLFTFDNKNSGYGVYSGDIGVNIGQPLGSSVLLASVSFVDPYVAGSYTRSAKLIFDTSYSLGSVKSIVWMCGPTSWQAELSEPLLHTSADSMTIYFQVSWGR